MKTVVFNIPGNQSNRQVESVLRQSLGLKLQSSDSSMRTYLDTFDWLFFNEGGVLETDMGSNDNWLVWRSLGGGKIFGRCQVEGIPRFVWNLKETDFRKSLEKIIKVRALLPVATVYSNIRRLIVLNGQDKIVLKVEIQNDFPHDPDIKKKNVGHSAISKRIHLYPVKGHKNVLKKTCRLLGEKCNLGLLEEDPLITSLKYYGSNPGQPSGKVTVTDPEQRADEAVRLIFLHLLDEMEKNEGGIKNDIDTEFLHDFRVAIRRTRALLGQIKTVIPKRRYARFKRDFDWIGKVSGPARDMDVYLLSFDELKSGMPAGIHEDLTPLYVYLQKCKFREHYSLIRTLDSERYKKLKTDWRKFLLTKSPGHSSLVDARCPIISIANRRIWHLFRKAYEQGNNINNNSPPTSLHELRKTCKKLRYLNEFFQNLYPEKKMQKLIKNLKGLQDNLGEFQDLQVQQESLRHFISEMENESGEILETRNAIEMLIKKLAKRQQKVRSRFDKRFSKFASNSNFMIYKKITSGK